MTKTNKVPVKTQEIDNELWFKIPNCDSFSPFLMSIVSDSNHWMFISSNGGITAGRKNSDYALFPYYTDDKLSENAHSTGSKTIVRVEVDSECMVWEPFTEDGASRYEISRNLYKNRYGNKVIFEEVNHQLELTFRYRWNSSNLYGFVRTATLSNDSGMERKISLLDGIQNILPYGVGVDLQEKRSNLVDAYKRSELIRETGLGIFALSAIIVDRAEPSEALKANVAWSFGLENPKYLVSSAQLENFRENEDVIEENDIKGERGAYFLVSDVELHPSAEKSWTIVANVNQNHSAVIALNELIKKGEGPEEKVMRDVEEGTVHLRDLVAGADGLQLTSDVLKDTRHFSNVLFNIMRGGIFDNHYQVGKPDYIRYLANANSGLYEKHQARLDALPDEFQKSELEEMDVFKTDPDFRRLAIEYLPLKFSRRHGDPSRPWNKFSINTRNEIDGSKILDYEGNWRDIFQNWEALAHSYPEFIEGMIYKFLNSSTFDGYNPYRVTKGGFDWETIEPDDPWSYIGYWGDHQIIYLLKFLEFHRDHHPDAFADLFRASDLVYAHVPYRIKNYEDILANPKDTIDFDAEADHLIREKKARTGADGSLLQNGKGEIHRVSFCEKILATVLAKLSNFIPEAGIWMNTQRPEWNDANNALVGNGVSMVTLSYLRRFLKFFDELSEKIPLQRLEVSKEHKAFFEDVKAVLTEYTEALSSSFTDQVRKAVTDGLGRAGSTFRNKIYESGFSGEKSEIDLADFNTFIRVALQHTEHCIRANRRDDGLFHAYNLITISDDAIAISRLEEMLEGQVAVLSSGYLNAEESLAVLNSLRQSALYREDQRSYLLYPNKSLPRFLERNNIPEESVKRSKLLQAMLEDDRGELINRDVLGEHHFNGNFKNAGDLNEALERLADSEYAELIHAEKGLLLEIFEETFNHKSFTGRSGTFFAYEGLGSIYWHMVSKLHLAVMEVCLRANEDGVNSETRTSLMNHFDEIGEGIGVHKDPELYGGFPTDPYSHTPAHRGAQQPGMTGQVKEDVLVRLGELGLKVENGELHFNPVLLKAGEFIEGQVTFRTCSVHGDRKVIKLPNRSLAFTYCQVPVVYVKGTEFKVDVTMSESGSIRVDQGKLDARLSKELFSRSGTIEKITVEIPHEMLR